MLTRLAVRLVAGLAVVAGVVTLTFVLLHTAPGDPAELLLGTTATPAQVAVQRHTLGLDRSLPVQYVTWLGAFARGDWGTSIASGRPVRAVLGAAWPLTAELVTMSLFFTYLFGIALGVVQAACSGSRLDTALSVSSVTLFALPGYWLALMLILLFTYQLRLLPAFGSAGFDADVLTGWPAAADKLRHLALPLVTLILIGVGGTARFVRGAMLDVQGQPFVVTARAKGLAPARVMLRHVLRNALIPVLTLLGLGLPALFSGAVFVEAVFAWPGVGRVLVEAVVARDYPVVLAATAVSALLVVAGNLLADALAAVADPRLRARDA